MSYFYHWRQIDVSYASSTAVQLCEILSEVAFWFFKHLIIIYYSITIQCNVESFKVFAGVFSYYVIISLD